MIPVGQVGTRMPDWLARRAVDHAERPALIAGHGPGALRWTFAELDARAGGMANRLYEAGVRAGTRVAVLLPNGPVYITLVHALTRLRAILVPLNLRLAPPEIAWQLEHARAGLLVYGGATAALAASSIEVRPALPHMQIEAVPERAHVNTVRSGDAHIDLGAVQCIMYTSGTTGRPKGALISYGNHWWSAIGSALNLGIQEGDRWLACLPLFHIGGLSILLRSVIYGIPVVLPDVPEEGEQRVPSFDSTSINEAIEAEAVTIISVVSTQLQRLLDAQPMLPAGTLRCVLLGGGPAPRPLLEECARRGVPVVQSYGLTEACSQVATLAPDDALRKLGSAGRPLLPTELRIAADPGDASGAGEILVRGPTITPGYLPDSGDLDGAVPAVDGDGWLHTGDAGTLDAEGYLYVLDRRTDMIISGGENIYPAEVESVLLAHPAVNEAGVYGVPDPRWGTAVAAAVVAAPGATIDAGDVLAFCRARLAPYKVPSLLRVVPALPRNAAGKLLRRELREGQA